MKTKLLLLFIFYTLTAYTQPATEKKLPWDYPVKPGMEEWEQLKTPQERIAICQIPSDILTSLSTQDLAYICMQYPNLLVTVFWSPYERGLDSLYREFNGIRELLKRKDAFKGLLNWYNATLQNLSFLNEDVPLVEKGFFSLRIAIAELLLSRCQLSDDPNNNYVDIVRHLVRGYEKKFAYPESFTDYSFSINCFSRAKIISKMDEQYIDRMSMSGSNSIFTRKHLDEQTRRAIDNLSYQIIKRVLTKDR